MTTPRKVLRERVYKGDFAAALFPEISRKRAKLKLHDLILSDFFLHRSLLRAGWNDAAQTITLRQRNILKRFGWG